MPLKLVSKIKTTITKEQLVEGFVFGWYEAFGTIPSKQAVGVLYSQNGIESGLTKSMWNYNVDNAKIPTKIPRDEEIEYFSLPGTWEIINGKKIVFPEGHIQTFFRSFPTLQEGMKFHLKFLKNGRYAASWTAIEKGSVSEFATILKARGYYTASASDYIKGMNLFYSPYMKSNMYENAIMKLQISTSTPVSEPEPTLDPDDPLRDMKEGADIDVVKETHQYVQVHKKLHQPWYQPLADAVGKLFSSFQKKK